MTTDDQSESKKYLSSGAGIGLAIGAGIGLMFGMLIPSIGIGFMAIGAVLGLIFGAAFASKRKSKSASP